MPYDCNCTFFLIASINTKKFCFVTLVKIIEILRFLGLLSGHYQALGRVIHMKYLKTQLRTQKNFDFTATRETMNLVQRLDILADTLYVEVNFFINNNNNNNNRYFTK